MCLFFSVNNLPAILNKTCFINIKPPIDTTRDHFIFCFIKTLIRFTTLHFNKNDLWSIATVYTSIAHKLSNASHSTTQLSPVHIIPLLLNEQNSNTLRPYAGSFVSDFKNCYRQTSSSSIKKDAFQPTSPSSRTTSDLRRPEIRQRCTASVIKNCPETPVATHLF